MNIPLRTRPRVRTTVITLTGITGALVTTAAITPDFDITAAGLISAVIGAIFVRSEVRDARQAAAAERLQSWARTRLMSAAEDRRKQLAAIANLRGETRDWEALWGTTNRQLRRVDALVEEFSQLRKDVDEAMRTTHWRGYAAALAQDSPDPAGGTVLPFPQPSPLNEDDDED